MVKIVDERDIADIFRLYTFISMCTNSSFLSLLFFINLNDSIMFSMPYLMLLGCCFVLKLLFCRIFCSPLRFWAGTQSTYSIIKDLGKQCTLVLHFI